PARGRSCAGFGRPAGRPVRFGRVAPSPPRTRPGRARAPAPPPRRTGRCAPSDPCREPGPCGRRGRRRPGRGPPAPTPEARSRTGARGLPGRAACPSPGRAGPGFRRAEGTRRACARAVARALVGPGCGGRRRGARGSESSCEPPPVCGRPSPGRARGRGAPPGRLGSPGCPPRRRRPPLARPGKPETARGRPGSSGSCAPTRPSRPPGSGGRRPPDRSCHRLLSLQLVAALFSDALADHLPPLRQALWQERRPALRAGFGDGPVPDDELAVRVVRARVEGAAPLRAALDNVAATAGLGAGDAERDRLGVPALRIARAGDELPVAPVLDHHRLAALLAGLAGRLVLGLAASVPGQVLGEAALGIGRARQEPSEAPPALEERLAAGRAGLSRLRAALQVLHLAARPSQILRETLVEGADGVDPRSIALLDPVELLLELGGELDVHDLREEREQEIRHLGTELRRVERALLAPHVLA